jgi:5-formyltetrahydrofolate cyclo-ligase
MNNLRQQIKRKLQNLTQELCLIASQKITRKITANEIFIHSQNIACYIPIENEINVWPIIKIIWQQGKNCYLPAFNPKTKNHLQFVRFFEHDKLEIKEYKILEPKIFPATKIIAPQNLDLVIVPLLGFNNNHFRLGRGAGCYDRTFVFKRQNLKIKPYLLGVGYKWQRIEFEPNTWDVAMNEIATS